VLESSFAHVIQVRKLALRKEVFQKLLSWLGVHYYFKINMGYYMSKLWSMGRSDREVKIVITGLHNAGKTTLLYKLALGEIIVTEPTIGSNVETLNRNGLRMQVWDLGG
jgi:GTPase SAR1 family protein